MVLLQVVCIGLLVVSGTVITGCSWQSCSKNRDFSDCWTYSLDALPKTDSIVGVARGEVNVPFFVRSISLFLPYDAFGIYEVGNRSSAERTRATRKFMAKPFTNLRDYLVFRAPRPLRLI